MKKYPIILVLFGLFTGIGCGKNGNFPSTPDLKYMNIYPHDVSDSQKVNITCSFKDQEGDVQGTIWFKTYNLTTQDNNVDTFGVYVMPSFPAQNNMEGTITLILNPGLDFAVGTPQGGGADSVCFELFIKDVAGHISDTVRTDTVLVHN